MELESISRIKEEMQRIEKQLETAAYSFSLFPTEYEGMRNSLDMLYSKLLKGEFRLDREDDSDGIPSLAVFAAIVTFFIAKGFVGFSKALLIGLLSFVCFFLLFLGIYLINDDKSKKKAIQEAIQDITIDNCMSAYEYDNCFFDEVQKLANKVSDDLAVKKISEERIGFIINKMNKDYDDKAHSIKECIDITVCGEKVNGISINELGLDSIDLTLRVALTSAICDKICKGLYCRVEEIESLADIKINTSYSYDTHDCFLGCNNVSRGIRGVEDVYLGDGVWETKLVNTPTRNILDRSKCGKIVGKVIITGSNNN